MPALSLIFSLFISFLFSIYSYELPFSEDYLLYLASRDFLSLLLAIVVCRKGVLDFIG